MGENPQATERERARRVAEAAKRALEEAAARQKNERTVAPAQEIDGPSGPEPTRYGDWERAGRTYDF